MKPITFILHSILLTASLALITSCEDDKKTRVKHPGPVEYAPIYNAEIADWLESERAKNQVNLVKIQAKLEKKPTDAKLQSKLRELNREKEKIAFRVNHGDYFAFKKPEDLPKNLNWTSGEPQPEIGDPKAKKGGTFTDFMTTFPPTLRLFGKEANHSFRGKIYDDIEIRLVGTHLVTEKTIPGIAKEWAVSEDRRTVYYRLNPKATYSDGEKVKALDFITFVFVRVSPFVKDPFAKQYYREQFAGITTYGDEVVAITLPEEKPRVVQAASMTPAPTHFYKHYGPDFVEHYQWKVQPTAGAYYIKEKDINKGVSITLTRVKDWWLKDSPYYKNAFNPDKITYLVVRDGTKAFELFRTGTIDYYPITSPKYWFEKTEIDPVFKGYIERTKFYTQYPRIPRGIYLNVSQPKLKDRNIRLGLQHAMNWQKVIDVRFRGEFSRLNQFHQGYGKFTDTSIKARKFSVSKAREYFAKAGYTNTDKEGYLTNDKGERLSVSLTFGSSSSAKDMMGLLQEDAKKTGLDLRLDALEGTVSYQKVMKKQHEMTFWGWGCGPPFPALYQFFHSSNAVDEKGQPKPNTNNINSYANPEMDKYCEGLRNARNEEELRKNAHAAQRLLHEEAIFIPSYSTDYFCVASWRWLCWPDSDKTPFNVPIVYYPTDTHLFWIDQEKKKETQAAKRQGKTFPEVQRVIDTFKDGIPESYKTP